ncbi:MAG: histidine phosphatase family protein [Candidatus Thermoplasmatota archaeon]
MGNLWLVRHGETNLNRERIIQGPRLDDTLSERGHRQAERLADALAPHPFGALYSSPLARARQTAAAIGGHAARRSLPIEVVPELYEMDYGRFAGQRYDDAEPHIEQLRDAWRMGYLGEPFPGGESPILAQHRVRPFCTRILAEAARHPIAVVGHGRLNRVLLATLTGAGLERMDEFPQSNAAITELAVNGGVARIVRLNDTAHLDLAGDGAFA